MQRLSLSLVLAVAIAVTLAAQNRPAQRSTTGAKPKPYTTWTQYLGGSDSAQFTALDQINRNTVSKLEVAWRYPVGERQIVFNPIVVDGVMYVQAKGTAIVALDVATGKELWVHPHEGPIGARGINYWQNADGSDRRLVYLNAGMMTELDARTGAAITSFGENGKVDLRKALDRPESATRALQTSNPGRIFEDLFIISLPASGAAYESNPADVQAYDIKTGKLAWVFHSIPKPASPDRRHGRKVRPATAGGGTQLERVHRRSGERDRLRPVRHRRAMTSSAATARATTCSPTAWWHSTRVQASGSGTSKPFITTCGTTTCRRRRSC
jgi:quinoprotein glucose dehydrogenase